MEERHLPRLLGWRDPQALGVVAMLLAVDIILILLYISMTTIGRPGGFVFDLGADRGYGEFFQYSKNLWLLMLLTLLLWRRRAGIYAIWMIVVAYFFVDDAFLLHERAGWAIRDLTPGKPGWAVHVGELSFVAAVGLVLAIAVAIWHVRAPREDRAASAVLIALFGWLIFFGIAVDAIHHLVFPGPTLRPLFTTIEDGGEMVVLSVMVAFVFALALAGHRPEPGRWLAPITDGRRASDVAESRHSS